MITTIVYNGYRIRLMADSIFLDFGNRSLMEVILPMMNSLRIEIFVWGLVFGV